MDPLFAYLLLAACVATHGAALLQVLAGFRAQAGTEPRAWRTRP